MDAIIWALRCQECGRWFFLCRHCFHGQRYCGDPCRQQARRRQCRAAQATYLAKRQGRLRRAAATAASRARSALGAGPARPVADSNRSRCWLAAGDVGELLPAEATCARCGVRGRVNVWH